MAKIIHRIGLPTHEPAVMGCKDGGCVTIVARKHKSDYDEPKMAMGGKVTSPVPPPLTTDFNVESITPHAGTPQRGKVKSSLTKKPTGIDYLKSKQPIEIT